MRGRLFNIINIYVCILIECEGSKNTFMVVCSRADQQKKNTNKIIPALKLNKVVDLINVNTFSSFYRYIDTYHRDIIVLTVPKVIILIPYQKYATQMKFSIILVNEVLDNVILDSMNRRKIGTVLFYMTTR